MNHDFAKLLPDYTSRVEFVPTNQTALRVVDVLAEQRPAYGPELSDNSNEETYTAHSTDNSSATVMEEIDQA